MKTVPVNGTFSIFELSGGSSGTNCPPRAWCMREGRVSGETFVVRKEYLARQAATLMKFANATTDRQVAARLVEKAVDLQCQLGGAAARPDRSPRAPDVEP